MKVLFITSLDFGELTLATIFARNQAFESAFAVPAKRLAFFDEAAGVIYSYSSVTELQRIIENEKPDVIALNTAYLFVNGALATMDGFKSFFQYLTALGCPIITTDPFGRVYDRYPECSLQIAGTQLEDLKTEITFLSGLFKKLPHMYGFPNASTFEKAWSFYNEKFCISENDRWRGLEKKDYWLFVLGELDCALLLAKHGDFFIIQLATRLTEICKNKENRVRGVFPALITKVLRDVLSDLDNLEILDFVTLKEFETLISESHAVFYWNVFSNSTLLCYYYNVPFLCFEKGHIADLSADLYGHMSEGIYCGGQPEFTDFFSPIEPRLDVLLQKHYSQENRRRILDAYQSLPSPQYIIERLTND
jgi:hypothetical protein